MYISAHIGVHGYGYFLLKSITFSISLCYFIIIPGFVIRAYSYYYVGDTLLVKMYSLFSKQEGRFLASQRRI